MSRQHNVIKTPLITEKNTLLRGDGKYVFEIDCNATKNDVKRAVESLFEVRVEKVNVSYIRPKKKRVGRHPAGYTPRRKKAVVKLEQGQTIKQMEEV